MEKLNTSLVGAAADGAGGPALQHGRAVRTAVPGRGHLPLGGALQHGAGLAAAHRRGVEAGALRAVVGAEGLARRVHLHAQQAPSLGRLDEVAATVALLAALPGHARDVVAGTVKHGTRLLRACDPAALAATLEARIFRDSHVSVFCHKLSVNAAPCTYHYHTKVNYYCIAFRRQGMHTPDILRKGQVCTRRSRCIRAFGILTKT
ncbi:hypothetical protein ANN_22971 [Periplaneta americana]|uniref:Uncharacterized protein n=1 Tax=Periplaneta americana TaxID=6978 RepID=A0ABQ8SJT2_PERAM|nr:hypothetical protein ANN_22971 [Periplaneta americana]